MVCQLVDDTTKRIYIVTTDSGTAELISQAPSEALVRSFSSLVDASQAIGINRPEILVLDYSPGAYSDAALLSLLMTYADAKAVRSILLHSGLTDNEADELKEKWKIKAVVDKESGAVGLGEALKQLL